MLTRPRMRCWWPQEARAALQAKLEATTKQRGAATQAKDQVQAQLNDAQAERDRAVADLKRELEQVAQAREASEQARDLHAQLQASSSDLQRQVTSAKDGLRDAEATVEAVTRERDAAGAELAAARADLASARSSAEEQQRASDKREGELQAKLDASTVRVVELEAKLRAANADKDSAAWWTTRLGIALVLVVLAAAGVLLCKTRGPRMAGGNQRPPPAQEREGNPAPDTGAPPSAGERRQAARASKTQGGQTADGDTKKFHDDRFDWGSQQQHSGTENGAGAGAGAGAPADDSEFQKAPTPDDDVKPPGAETAQPSTAGPAVPNKTDTATAVNNQLQDNDVDAAAGPHATGGPAVPSAQAASPSSATAVDAASAAPDIAPVEQPTGDGEHD